MNELHSQFWTDENGNPAGGQASAIGVSIAWQRGPLEAGGGQRNGAFLADVITLTLMHAQDLQGTKFACPENEQIIHHLSEALRIQEERIQRRQEEGKLGTHQI